MLLGDLHQSHVITIFSLFFGAVGTGFALTGDGQYAMISLLVAGLAGLFNNQVSSSFKRNEAQISFGLELKMVSDVVVYGLLPASFLIRLLQATTASVFVASLYILAVGIRLAHFNRSSRFQKPAKEGFVHGIPHQLSAVVIPTVSLVGYFASLSVTSMVVTIVYLILGIGFILQVELPKIPNAWNTYVLIYGIVLVIVYMFLGSYL